MKLNKLLLVTCAVLAVACGRRNKEVHTSKTQELTLTGDTMEQDFQEISEKSRPVETKNEDGTTETRVVDRDQLKKVFTKWLADNKVTLTQEDADALVTELSKDLFSYPVFKHALKFASIDFTGPRMQIEEGVKYAKGLLKQGVDSGLTAASEIDAEIINPKDVMDSSQKILDSDIAYFAKAYNNCVIKIVVTKFMQDKDSDFENAQDSDMKEAMANAVEVEAARLECLPSHRDNFVKRVSPRWSDL